MRVIVSALQRRARYMGVDLGRGEIRVAQHGLDSPEVSASLQEVRSEAVSQLVWGDGAIYPRGPRVAFQGLPETLSGQPFPSCADEERSGWTA